MNKTTAILFAGFVATVYGANWALEQWGVIDLPIVGLAAPAGVFFAGIAFGLRDALHEAGGKWLVFAAIIIGSALSWVLSDAISIPGGVTSIAVASATAFLLAELADFAVYSPLREKQWTVAVIASNIVGAVLDSLIFLWLAFGSVDFISGQIVGKVLMIAPAIPFVWGVRRVVSGDSLRPQSA